MKIVSKRAQCNESSMNEYANNSVLTSTATVGKFIILEINGNLVGMRSSGNVNCIEVNTESVVLLHCFVIVAILEKKLR